MTSKTVKMTPKPNHPEWEGFQKVYDSFHGRSVAQCTQCLHKFANTSRHRLMKHKIKCDGTVPRGGGTVKAEPTRWITNSSPEWTGFKQSEQPNSFGVYTAQCQKCYDVVEALNEDMQEHLENCHILEEEDNIEEDVEESIIDVADEHYEPDSEESPKEVFVVKGNRMAMKKINPLNYTTSAVFSAPAKRPRESLNAAAIPPPPPVRITKFDDVSRVWAQKLEDLPMEIALNIEKKMSDMLYEAMLDEIKRKRLEGQSRIESASEETIQTH